MLSRILQTLRVRYTLDMIYTYSGNILIAVRAERALHWPPSPSPALPAALPSPVRLATTGVPAAVQRLAAGPQARARLQANPHKRVRQLYGARMMTSYRGVPLGELSPHVYAIAEQVGPTSLRAMLTGVGCRTLRCLSSSTAPALCMAVPCAPEDPMSVSEAAAAAAKSYPQSGSSWSLRMRLCRHSRP